MSGSGEPSVVASERRLGKRIIGWVVGLLLVLLALVAITHIVIRPIPPDQAAPAGHFPGPCAACHLVTAGADAVETP